MNCKSCAGAIVGDIVGSRFERRNIKTKDFLLFHKDCSFTDDSVMTLAVANALIENADGGDELETSVVRFMQEYGRRFPNAGYGGDFLDWIYSSMPQPYNSWGNGAAMRVSACGWCGNSLEEVRELSRIVTSVTHNHPEGLKGAEATAVATYLARTGSTKEVIRDVIVREYYPKRFTLNEIRDKYRFDVSCQGTVPQALQAFFESVSFEDAIRNAVSIGGDSDTIAAICGAVAGAYWGIPKEIWLSAAAYLDPFLLDALYRFEVGFTTTLPVKPEELVAHCPKTKLCTGCCASQLVDS